MSSLTVKDYLDRFGSLEIEDQKSGFKFWSLPKDHKIGGKIGRDSNGKIVML